MSKKGISRCLRDDAPGLHMSCYLAGAKQSEIDSDSSPIGEGFHAALCMMDKGGRKCYNEGVRDHMRDYTDKNTRPSKGEFDDYIPHAIAKERRSGHD